MSLSRCRVPNSHLRLRQRYRVPRFYLDWELQTEAAAHFELIPKLIISVPGNRKAQVVRRTLEEPLSTDCPSTLLGTHPDAMIYLDVDSASELHGLALPH